jgi:hypothetical protein
LYQFWRNFENLPKFMHHLESVQNTGDNRSHWVARGPLGTRVAWDAEVITERPNELIGWRSLEGSQADTAGSVHFTPAPGDRGTEVRVVMKYNPPLGKVGAAIAWLFAQEPGQQVADDLRRLKQLMETGEIPTTAGQPTGRGVEQWQQTGQLVVEHRVARGLGWFSIGLGLAEVLAPGALGQMIGLDERDRKFLPLLGLREIASGVGILNGYRPTGWLWARFAGDLMDLAFLTAACNSPNAHPGRITAAALAVAGVTAADLVASLELSRDPRELTGGPSRD